LGGGFGAVTASSGCADQDLAAKRRRRRFCIYSGSRRERERREGVGE
ncbi:hypothetical protein LINGRAHAP2_LOCUS25515, partial [Linum grandiflorum]